LVLRRSIILCRSSMAINFIPRVIANVRFMPLIFDDVPLPTPTHRGLAESLVLPSDDPAALLGFLGALRRFAPADGWRIISDRAGPTCLFVQSSRPD
jgi:hypothetical protein